MMVTKADGDGFWQSESGNQQNCDRQKSCSTNGKHMSETNHAVNAEGN